MNDHDPTRPPGASPARKVPLPSPPRQTIEPPTEVLRAEAIRSVAPAAAAELPRSWAWIATALLVAVAGLSLYLVRGALAPVLDRWLTLPLFGDAVAETVPVAEEPAPEPVAEEPSGPVWDYPRIEEALEPLTVATEQLIAEGRDELPGFRGLASRDESRALLMRNRWERWGRVWNNRVAALTSGAPPLDSCRVHAALEPTCQALDRAFAFLAQVPAAANVDDAQARLDQAADVLAELRLWQQESAEPEPAEDEGTADGVVSQ